MQFLYVYVWQYAHRCLGIMLPMNIILFIESHVERRVREDCEITLYSCPFSWLYLYQYKLCLITREKSLKSYWLLNITKH